MARVRFGSDDDDAYERWRDQLIVDFGRWLTPLRLRVDPDDLGLLLDWKRHYGDGQLDRWTRAEEEEFLLGWCPRHLSATAEEVHGLPAAVSMAMSFLATRDLMAKGSDPLEGLVDHGIGLQSKFMAEMDNPANFGMAKSMFSGLGLGADQLGDPEALQQAIDDFNALPEEERRRLSGRFGPTSDADTDGFGLPPIGPVILPDPDAVRASAEASPVLAGFDRLADYLAPPGRLLTKAGNLKLADAQRLVELLGTGEKFENTFGDQTFRTRSAAHLRELDHWQWWARESGAIRKHRDRLVGVKAWGQRRRADPVQAVREAFQVMVDHGLVASYVTWYRGATVAFVDACVVVLMLRLLCGPQPFDETVALLDDLRSKARVRESYPGDLANLFERQVILLERAGLLQHTDYAMVGDQWGREHRSGGALSLTAVGVMLGIELAEDSDIVVDVVADPAVSTVEMIVARVESLGPEEWWQLAGRWLTAQPEADPAVESLFAHLGARSAHWQMLAIEAAPTTLRTVLEPILRRHAAHDPMTDESAAALHWLLSNDLTDPAEIDPARLLDGTLTSLGILAEASPEDIPRAFLDGDGDADAYEIIDAALERMPARAEILLDAIGANYPDKRVAKAARKALFRLRDRLAGPGR